MPSRCSLLIYFKARSPQRISQTGAVFLQA
jgi:hypothetical protein